MNSTIDTKKEHAVYSDGSGKASDILREALQSIDEYEKNLSIKRLFIEKHKDTLAGLRWWCPHANREVEIWTGYYRAKPASAKDIARLWPDAQWTKRQDAFSKEQIDWVAEIDGITLVIEKAEKLPPPKPTKIPKGTKVIL